MSTMRLLHVVGARPNYMKVAVVMQAARRRGAEQLLVHTGQHYDAQMSDVFFADLGLPPPDVLLGVGSGSHAEQTAKVMLGFEPVLEAARPDWVVVVGDVNSTVAAALVAAKRGIRVAHVEAGLRSFDRTMPEELNRIVTDQLADLLLTPSVDADDNLLAEGRPIAAIRRVGNVMIDALALHLPRARSLGVPRALGLARRSYAVLTLHRPSNVDDPRRLSRLLALLGEVASQLPILFPVHPRTRERLEQAPRPEGLRLMEPLGYLRFLGLLDGACLALTDSGGIQEETTALGIPCLTLRDNTERPITVVEGTNHLVGDDPLRLRRALARALDESIDDDGPPHRPALWDGHAAERVVAALDELGTQPETALTA
jgi:UDP-N-acetylglucosamine 2-epimerase (non-hydrolysing)